MIKDQDFVDAVRAHAVQNYNKDGWDYVVECWEDEDILEVARGCKTTKAAINKVHKQIKVLADYRDDIVASGY